jgi:hypothetical protein
MKDKLLQLKREAVRLIKSDRLTDSSALARLGPIPAKIDQMENQMQQILDEVQRIEIMLEGFSHTIRPTSPVADDRASDDSIQILQNGRRGRKKIRIEVNWPLLGGAGKREIICEHMASDTLVRFLTRLYEVMGVSVLEKLAHFKVNRGMLVSRNPSLDYRNASDPSGKLYQHQPIAGSGFSALTHSSTNEKLFDVRKACQFLQFSAGAIKVEEVGKYEIEY